MSKLLRQQVIDKTGKVVIDLKWDHDNLNGLFSEGLATMKQKDNWGFIDRTGQIVLPLTWKTASPFMDDGLAAVEVDGKCGFIDKSGKMIIPPVWGLSTMGGADDIRFWKGRAIVNKDGRLGVIDPTGKVLIAPEWDKFTYQPPYANGGFYAERFADHTLKMPDSRIDDWEGPLTPERIAYEKFANSPHPAETAWFDHDGKMIWHSW